MPKLAIDLAGINDNDTGTLWHRTDCPSALLYIHIYTHQNDVKSFCFSSLHEN